jgi:hypothetical protein
MPPGSAQPLTLGAGLRPQPDPDGVRVDVLFATPARQAAPERFPGWAKKMGRFFMAG